MDDFNIKYLETVDYYNNLIHDFKVSLKKGDFRYSEFLYTLINGYRDDNHMNLFQNPEDILLVKEEELSKNGLRCFVKAEKKRADCIKALYRYAVSEYKDCPDEVYESIYRYFLKKDANDLATKKIILKGLIIDCVPICDKEQIDKLKSFFFKFCLPW